MFFYLIPEYSGASITRTLAAKAAQKSNEAMAAGRAMMAEWLKSLIVNF
ncbi:MAG TPA: hypothetical protein VFG54_00990 [Prolixibacteraceae bacterium]|nr:hypothetical protein [Prolixibacteraceae bacterium]